MDDKQFDAQCRRLVLENSDRYRYMMLSVESLEILKLFTRFRRVITARRVSDSKKISLQSASRMLRELYRKGYLKRKQCKDPNGGIYYEYRRWP